MIDWCWGDPLPSPSKNILHRKTMSVERADEAMSGAQAGVPHRSLDFRQVPAHATLPNIHPSNALPFDFDHLAHNLLVWKKNALIDCHSKLMFPQVLCRVTREKVWIKNKKSSLGHLPSQKSLRFRWLVRFLGAWEFFGVSTGGFQFFESCFDSLLSPPPPSYSSRQSRFFVTSSYSMARTKVMYLGSCSFSLILSLYAWCVVLILCLVLSKLPANLQEVRVFVLLFCKLFFWLAFVTGKAPRKQLALKAARKTAQVGFTRCNVVIWCMFLIISLDCHWWC